MDARELYLLSVKENGISESSFAALGSVERSLLEKRADGKYWLSPAERSKFRVVLTGGVFDVLHMGHVLTVQKARELGDLLVVVVTTDERVEQVSVKIIKLALSEADEKIGITLVRERR